MNSILLCEASHQYLKYVDNTTLFKDRNGKLFLYKLETTFYEDCDCDTIVHDTLGNALPINIADIQEFIDAFKSIITSNITSISILKNLINPNKDNISGNKK